MARRFGPMFAIGLWMMGCRGAPSAPSSADASAADASPDARAPMSDVASDPRTWLLARGRLHVEPIDLGGARWLGFVGDAEVARVPWLVSGCGEAPCAGENLIDSGLPFPVSARVLDHAYDSAEGVLRVRVSSLPFLGQPGGLTGVVTIALPRSTPREGLPPAAVDLHLANLPAGDSLAAAIAALRERGISETSREEQEALTSLFAKAGKAGSALAGLADSEGLDVEIAWQGVFRERIAHLTPKEIARSALLPRLVSMVRSASAPCTWATSPARSREAMCGGERGHVVARRRGDAMVISSVLFIDPPPSDAPVLPGARVPSIAPRPATQALASEAFASATVLAEAAWSGSGGALALLRLPPSKEGERARLAAFTALGSHARATELWVRGFWDGKSPIEAAFADIDGDGRADLILRTETMNSDEIQSRVFLSPRHASAASEPRISPDGMVAPYLRGDAGLDDAVRRALSAPRGRVDPREARASIAARRGTKGLRLFYDGDAPALLEAMPVEGLRRLLPDCQHPGGFELTFSCDQARPFCQAHCRTEGGTGEPGSYFTYVFEASRRPLAVDVILTDRRLPAKD